MSLPIIEPRAFYGLTNGIKGNASYISENEILYPAGRVLVVHNYAQKLQRYIQLPEKPINIICVSPLRTVVAVAERGDKPCISIYNLSTLKLKQVLGQSIETAAQEYVSLSFSFDGKFLAAILGDPDWTMVYFECETGEVGSTVNANYESSINPGRANQVVCNPKDSSVIVIVGPQLFRMLSVTEGTWYQYGWSKPESLRITSVAWLSSDHVIGGTSDGNLLLVDSGELTAIYKAMTLTTIDINMRKEVVSVSAMSLGASTGQVPHPEMEVRALISFTKGFAFACGSGMVHLFVKETSSKYTKMNVFHIPQPGFQDVAAEDLNIVHNLNVSPEEDQLLATTMRSQMFSVRLWNPDVTQADEVPFKMVGEQLHHGPVVGLSVCAWKPLFMTCGHLDCTVRVWNYETETQEIVKQYEDGIFSVAIHPTGLYAVIGFSDMLRFMALTVDDMHPCHEFYIRGCCECCFSNSGHLFAAVNGDIIQVYSSVSFENLYNLKGHNGKVKSLIWTQRDLKLVSCGTEGAIYEWDIPSGTRAGEIITKNCMFSSIAATADGKTSFGTGNDGCITEISESAIVQTVNITGQQLDCIVLSRSNQMMFVAAENGSVLSVNYPLQKPIQYAGYNMHDCPVTRMCMSYNDLTLITCSMDGSVCIWKITYTEGKMVKMDSEFKPSIDVLISKVDLLEMIQRMKELSLRMQELKMEHEYEIQKNEKMHAEKLKEVQDGYCQAIEALTKKNEQLDSDHTAELNSINDDITRMKTTHEEEIMAMDTDFSAKLIVQFDKYQQLEEHTNKMREDYEKKLVEISQQKENDLNSTIQAYETKLQERDMQIKDLHTEADREVQEHEAIKQLIEDDADCEIMELRKGYEKQLLEERETNLRLRGETAVMKKKFISSQREAEELKHQAYMLQQDQQKFQQSIVELQQDISSLKKELSERESIIEDKEKQIYGLKRKNQELDKFKFVLNYKITELENQLKPKDKEIKDKNEQIQEMQGELEKLHKNKTSLEFQLAEMRDKLNATSNEYASERERNQQAEALFRCISFDLHTASRLIQEPKKLKDTVTYMYHKYGQDPDLKSREQEIDVQTEFMRQREHMEHTIASLKRQAHRNTSGKQDDISKMIDENSGLIIELNNLRQELKDARKHIRDMESILGISSKCMNAKEAKAKLQMAVQNHEDIHTEYKSKLEEKERVITMLKEEVDRLVHKLTKDKKERYP